MAVNTLNMDEVRGSFPALSSPQVFLDNAGGSQALGSVAERVRDYLVNTNVQLGATYTTGKEATRRYAEGYAAAAKYINASGDEIVLGSSTTQLFRNTSYALDFDEGDELVVSALDHEANIAPWVDLAKRQKLLLKWWLPSSDSKTNPKLLAKDLESLLTDRTRLVTCTHASNILGTIHDINGIAEVVHSRSPKALLCVDAVAYAPHREIDVKELGVDLYAYSWYKVFGPHIAMLYASPRALEQVQTLGHFFNPQNTLEEKLGLAGSSYELVSAIPAVVEYIGTGTATTKWAGIVAQEHQLAETLLSYLNARDDVTVWGETSADPALRVPTISFTVQGRSSRQLVETVEKETEFGFRWGSFYSVRLVEQFFGLGEDGVVRVSMVHYNTVDEVTALIAALDSVLARGE
ncbi:pyridoxal phosphate-dependent transferase [Podospora appendiculata]|uniref:Pyridoxal phosphate-dependent transferase n=1 Tax=Podospora appendiculata TaxID=314037 RepID=A0AAE0XKE4_9PEZI|nr:pyridoxal phosphate-dependent transferase [Podospora appendiculata]